MPGDTKMVSMKISASERDAKYSVAAEPSQSGPSYPYGLCLHLDDDVMKKLAMQTLPKVGTQVIVYALADVVSVSERESLIGGASQSVELQITDLAPLTAKGGKDAGDALYAKG